ncbi:MAG: DUF5107 domain-containing protein [Anaerolineae bacterium]
MATDFRSGLVWAALIAWQQLLRLGPYVIGGVVLAALLGQLDLVGHWSGTRIRGGFPSVLGAAFLGSISPLPTHSATPVLLRLIKNGASPAPAVAFLTASSMLNPQLFLTSYWLPRVVMEADVLIGVPVLKNHSNAGITLALRNQFGIAPSDIYHNVGSHMFKGALEHGPDDLGRHIVDLNLARPLDFVVVDGRRGMTNGPIGGTLANPPMRLILAEADPVAVDTVGSLVMGYDPATIPYLGAMSPTVQLTAPENGIVVTPQVTIWASASDDRTVTKGEFYVEDQRQVAVTAPPYRAVLDLSAYRGRTVSLRAIAYDRALNDAQDETTVTVVQAPDPGITSFQTATITIPTYPYSHCLETRSNGPYIYPWLDWDCYGHPSPVSHDYTLLVLENDYLRVTVLPELGGRVYQMIFKPTGHNVLYQNPVVKPTRWGPPEQGWWLAVGGIEWCLPVDEHGYEWGIPWAWSVVTSTAGVTVTVRDTDASNRLRARVDLFLPADRAYLAVTPHLENPTGHPISYKFWLNSALAPGGENRPTAGLQFVFNADQMAVHSTGDSRLPGHWPTQPTGPNYRFSWPIYNGTDFSWLSNWRQWLGFFEYPQAGGDFAGVYSHDTGQGVARVFPSAVAQGSKGFAFGWSNPIDWHEWTDDGSGGVEIHGGVAPTFWDEAVLAAGQTLSWTEYWYPTGAIGSLSAATAEAALGVRLSGGQFYIGLHTTTAHAAGETTLYVWDRSTCAELARRALPAFDPAAVYLTSLPAAGRSLQEIAVVYLDREGNLLGGFNSTDCLAPTARVAPLPPWVAMTPFTVTWSGEDIWSGMAGYDVQYRDGYEGIWTDWLTDTMETSAPFAGQHGHTYFFRARARDGAGNWSTYGDEEWGQAFTSLLTEPAPILVTSRKIGLPRLFGPDETVAYTVLISNTGNLTATAILTDTPPTEMVVLTHTLSATSGPVPLYADGAILWEGMVPPDAEVRVTYVLSPTPVTPFMVPLTNTAQIEGSALGPTTRRTVVMQARLLWLPFVTR